jgi:hypothetical protein
VNSDGYSVGSTPDSDTDDLFTSKVSLSTKGPRSEVLLSDAASIQARVPHKHLVLHFDVNKTIVLNDSIKKQSVQDVLNLLLAEDAWGELSSSTSGELKWTLLEDSSKERPEGAVTYIKALEQMFGGKDGRKTREKMASRFTEPGQPGEKLRSIYEKLCEGLHGEMPADPGEICILPGFFYTLAWLWRRGASFSVVFRTFGEDLPKLIEHFNRFCEGRQPGYEDIRMDGSDGKADLRISQERTGSWFRSSNGFCGLVWGDSDCEKEMINALGNKTEPDERHLEKFVESLNSQKPLAHGQRIVSAGLENVVQALACLEKPCALGLRDYFPYWNGADRRGSAGKLLLVDSSNDVRLDVFFDDNVQESLEDTGIIDVRDTVGKAMTPLYAHRYHLVRADARAILEDNAWYLCQLASKLQETTNHHHHLSAKNNNHRGVLLERAAAAAALALNVTSFSRA